MKHWWEIPTADQLQVVRPRAVAYYRHSAQDRQENSIPIQQDQVREWADLAKFTRETRQLLALEKQERRR